MNKPWSNSSLDYANNNGNPPYNINYPSGASPGSSATSAKVYKTNATTNKTGLGIVLKVMAGDKIDIHGKSYYQGSSTYNNSNSTTLSLSDLMGSLMGSPDNTGLAQKGINSTMLGTINSGLIPSTFFRGNDGTSSTVPKAYINYLLFDEQFKFVGGDFSRVGASGVIKSHWFDDIQLQGIAVPKNGYLYVYVSNESNADVFFDNLQVFHTRGAILEETHYYPFGLTMVGISSKALAFGAPNNKFKYNGKEEQQQEFSDGSGLEWTDFGARAYDNQIGRWTTNDPWAEKYERQSPYVGMNDNPVVFNDPTGKGGELTIVKNEETGEWYLKVTAKIYLYSKKGIDEAKKHASKIQNDIMTQWNNPTETDENGNPIDGAKAYGQYGNMKGKVVFDVTVEAISIEDAEEKAKNNTDLSVNFMGLTETDKSKAKGNSGEFNVFDLYSLGSTDAAHEFGHLLGYYNKYNTNYANNDPEGGLDVHATKRITPDRNETYYIMGGYHGDQSKRRVDPEEYSRVNHGLGIRINNANIPVPIVVDPSRSNNDKNNLTNTIYK